MSALPAMAIEVRGLKKAFGAQIALAGIDLDVEPGSYVALMGPNGAGKTTLLKAIAGLVSPSRGSVSLAGVDMRKAGPALRAAVGFVSHETMLYADLTGRENLLFHARLFGLPQPGEAIQHSAEELGVAHALDKPVRALSRGTRQRVGLARALLHGPRVLLMDEPYTGLDEAGAASLSQLLLDLHTPDRTLIVTIHEVARAAAGPERLVVLDAGRIVLDQPILGTAEELARVYLDLLGVKQGVLL